jgi:hypothetical protein
MPNFDNKFTFIHIPKSGGSSIEKFMVDNGYEMTFYDIKGKNKINRHTPQHCTFRELEDLSALTENIFTIVRPNIDRVVSEFFYIKIRRPDVDKKYKNFDGFLDLFLDKRNSVLFDNHNLSNNDFLINKFGEIDSKIKIFNFFDIKSIEEYLGLKGLGKYKINCSQSTHSGLKFEKRYIDRINKFYEED